MQDKTQASRERKSNPEQIQRKKKKQERKEKEISKYGKRQHNRRKTTKEKPTNMVVNKIGIQD